MMNGLSTLNRLLGKKNKDVSKSTSNLSRSITNLDSSSQYNKIVPLAAMNNAPFEQTFRITVLLPRDQLYVTRIGAKTKLYVLLEMICDDKQLDSQKYEFRHPADYRQGFDNELTIGEVGLNEIRLVSKTELYTNDPNSEYRFNTSDIFRYQRNNIRESSLSSSDLSRTSKLPMKTTSPYSSTNSLNSMDSSGMSNSSKSHHPPVAPTRKKRVAPRPPSQNSIPEQETIPNGHIFKEPQLPPYSRKNFHVSSPNLYQENNQQHISHFDTIEELNIINKQTSYNNLKNRPTSMYIIREPDVNGNDNGKGGNNIVGVKTNGGSIEISHSRTSSGSSEVKDPNYGANYPAPLPRKRLFSSSGKKGKAPAPPPRVTSKLQSQSQKIVPTPSPRALTRSMNDLSRDNETVISETDSNYSETDDIQKIRDNVNILNAINGHHNVSKVMLNVEEEKSGSVSIKIISNHENKTPSPIISKVHIIPETMSSSDEDDKVKIYNIETALSKTITNLNEEEKPLDSPRTPSPTLWTYTLPAPPRFADSSIKSSAFDDKKIYDNMSSFVDNTTVLSDPITSHFDELDDIKPVIKERIIMEEPSSPTGTLNTSESSAMTADILINSDIEDGYHGGDQKSVRESLLLTLEKRREKIIENEFEFLTNEIDDDDNEVESVNDIMKCAKFNEEIKSVVKKNEVMNELNDFLSNNKNGDSITLINNQKNLIKDDLNDNSALSNFKISTYNSCEIVQNGDQNVLKEKNHNGAQTNVHISIKNSVEIDATVDAQNGVENEKENDDQNVIKNFENIIKNKFKKVEQNGVAKTNAQNDVQTGIIQNGIVQNGIQEVVENNVEKSVENIVLNGVKQNGDENTLQNGDKIQNIEEKKEIIVSNRKISLHENGNSSEEEVILRRKISSDSIRKLSSDEEEAQYRSSYNSKKEMAPVKRRSLTVLNKSPKSINRSDSFHSTRSDYIQSLATAANLNLTPRSTSYISLIGAQKWENRNNFTQFNQINRRKSTSEMSITDSPSLQSLEVIKHILNSSRKNSISQLPGEEIEKIEMAKIKRNSFTDISTLVQMKSSKKEDKEPKILEVKEEKVTEPREDFENKSKSDDEKLKSKLSKAEPKTTIVNITATSTTTTSTPINSNENESDSKKWKYQGPPTINFTTWNERPKIDVSIKSDKDYKFGGCSTLPRGFRNVNGTTKINLTSTTMITHEPQNNHNNNGVGEDVVDHVPFKSLSQIDTSERLPIVRSVEYKKNIKIPPSDNKPNTAYFYDNFSRNNTSTTTVNRISLNFNKVTPVVKGFKEVEEEPVLKRSISLADKPAVSPKPITNRFSSFETNSSVSIPFSQNTLRRTGLKDKILASSNNNNNVETAPKTNGFHKHVEKKKEAVTAPPPPPPVAPKTVPIVRGVVIKKQLPPPQVDPRSQLLDAIKSFNKDSLKK